MKIAFLRKKTQSNYLTEINMAEVSVSATKKVAEPVEAQSPVTKHDKKGC